MNINDPHCNYRVFKELFRSVKSSINSHWQSKKLFRFAVETITFLLDSLKKIIISYRVQNTMLIREFIVQLYWLVYIDINTVATNSPTPISWFTLAETDQQYPRHSLYTQYTNKTTYRIIGPRHSTIEELWLSEKIITINQQLPI